MNYDMDELFEIQSKSDERFLINKAISNVKKRKILFGIFYRAYLGYDRLKPEVEDELIKIKEENKWH